MLHVSISLWLNIAPTLHDERSLVFGLRPCSRPLAILYSAAGLPVWPSSASLYSNTGLQLPRAQLVCKMSVHTMYWLVAGTILGTISSGLVYMATSALRGFRDTVHNQVFLFICRRYNFAEHRLKNTTNITTIPRILFRIGLRSHRYIWHHDANADAGDAVQWGFLSIPTHSWGIYLLSLFHVSHYIHIDMNLSYIDIVGPQRAVNDLIRLSNSTNNKPISDSELLEVKTSFGLSDGDNDFEDVVLQDEKMLLAGLLGIVIISISAYFFRTFFGMEALCAVAFVLTAAILVGKFVHSTVVSWGSFSFVDAETGLTASLLEATAPSGAAPHPLHFQSLTVRSDSFSLLHELESDTQNAWEAECFSLLVSKNHYYEVSLTLPVQKTSPSIIQAGSQNSTLFGVPVGFDFVYNIAACTCRPPGTLLYICVYNPLTDPPLSNFTDQLRKTGDKVIQLVVILPPLGSFSAALANTPGSRTGTDFVTQFVHTRADFEAALLLYTSGIMSSLVFVFPLDIPALEAETNPVWLGASHIMPSTILYSI